MTLTSEQKNILYNIPSSTWIKKLFCIHRYVPFGYGEITREDTWTTETIVIGYYKIRYCEKCGKIETVRIQAE